MRGPTAENFSEILSADALRFVARLQREFNGRRKELLEWREKRQAEIDQGKKPDFLPETAHIREGDWRVAPTPGDLQDRRVGITGPTHRTTGIKGLDSNANGFMAAFRDADPPNTYNMLERHL